MARARQGATATLAAAVMLTGAAVPAQATARTGPPVRWGAAGPQAVLPAPAGPQTVLPAPTGPQPLVLPAPTGPHPVGMSTMHLVDPGRRDPWTGTRPRELMVSVWYPARRAIGSAVPYASADESRLLLAQLGVTGVPPDAFAGVGTHARVDAPPLARRLPLVLLSPGFGHPRWLLSGLAEELASRGYAVAGVDHTYEAAAVTFPDGRIAECLACRQDPAGHLVAGGRALDLSFVLDRLTGRRPAWRHAGLLDRTWIGVVGHSMGGAAAARLIQADPRVRAGVNLDGSFQPVPSADLHRPFLLIGSAEDAAGADPNWDAGWSRLAGWRRWLRVAGTTHSSFTDLAPLGDLADRPIQPMRGDLAAEITRRYVRAFLDLHLRDRPQPLLDGPSPAYPDVLFEHPADPPAAG